MFEEDSIDRSSSRGILTPSPAATCGFPTITVCPTNFHNERLNVSRHAHHSTRFCKSSSPTMSKMLLTVFSVIILAFVVGFSLGGVIVTHQVVRFSPKSSPPPVVQYSPNSLPINSKPKENQTLSRHTPLVDGVYWSSKVESILPRGFTEADIEDWNFVCRSSRVVKLEEGCGRMQNRLLTFEAGAKSCCRYRLNIDQVSHRWQQ